jgi:hypothetical protein
MIMVYGQAIRATISTGGCGFWLKTYSAKSTLRIAHLMVLINIYAILAHQGLALNVLHVDASIVSIVLKMLSAAGTIRLSL